MATVTISKLNLKNSVANVIISSYFVLVIVGQFFEGERLLPAVSALGFCAFVWQIPYIYRSQKNLFFVFLLFAVYTVFCVFIFQGRTSLTSMRLFVHFVFFVLLIRYDIKSWMIRVLVIAYSLFICGSVLLFSVNPNAIFADSSKNFVGWIGLAMGVLYYSLRYKNQEKIEVYTAAIILLLAFVCVGRSTILSAILLFLAVFLTSYRQFSLVTKIFAISFLASLLLFLFSGYFELIELAFTQFERKGFESEDRAIVLRGYIDKLNFVTFLFGVTPNQYPFTILNGNLHNSFLLAHSLFGIFSVFFFIYVIYMVLRNGLEDFFLKALLATILIRSFTDTLLFVAFFDFIVFYLLYLLWNQRRRPIKSHSANSKAI